MTIAIWQCFIVLLIVGILLIITKNRSEIIDWIFKNNDSDVKEEKKSISMDFFKQQHIENTDKFFNMSEVNNFSTVEELNNILYKIKDDHDLVAILNFNGALSLATIIISHTVGLLEVDTVSGLKDLMNTFSKYEVFDTRIFLDDIVCSQLKIKNDVKLSFLSPLSPKMNSYAVILVSISQELKEW